MRKAPWVKLQAKPSSQYNHYVDAAVIVRVNVVKGPSDKQYFSDGDSFEIRLDLWRGMNAIERFGGQLGF